MPKRKSSRFQRVPGPSARALLLEHNPFALFVGPKLRVERFHQLQKGAVDDRRVIRQLAMTHVGPLAENPVSANAASVPTAAVRFWTKPAPSFSSSGKGRGRSRLRSGDLRGELLEHLQRLAGRNVAGEERIGREILRRTTRAGVSQPRRHSRPWPLERERDLVLFRTRRCTLLEEHVLHPGHAASSTGGASSSAAIAINEDASIPISQPTPR